MCEDVRRRGGSVRTFLEQFHPDMTPRLGTRLARRWLGTFYPQLLRTHPLPV